MKETPYGIQYTWSDLKPILPLTITGLVAQIVGCIIGVVVGWHPRTFLNLWLGGALATFPAFLVGLAVQEILQPGRIGEHDVMVRRMGLAAFFVTLFGVAIPVFGLFDGA